MDKLYKICKLISIGLAMLKITKKINVSWYTVLLPISIPLTILFFSGFFVFALILQSAICLYAAIITVILFTTNFILSIKNDRKEVYKIFFNIDTKKKIDYVDVDYTIVKDKVRKLLK